MNKSILLFLGILCSCILVSCGGSDSPSPSYTIKGKVQIEDIQNLPASQRIEFGLFDNNGFNIKQRSQLQNISQNTFSFNIKNINGSYLMKLFISENGIYKSDIHVFSETEINQNLNLSANELKILTFNRIQQQVFNRCIQCHGVSEEIAAGLNLQEGNSYANLVNIKAKNSTKNRVEPSSSENSFIMQVLNKQNLNFDHSASTSATKGDIELVKNWINTGALNQ